MIIKRINLVLFLSYILQNITLATYYLSTATAPTAPTAPSATSATNWA